MLEMQQNLKNLNLNKRKSFLQQRSTSQREIQLKKEQEENKKAVEEIKGLEPFKEMEGTKENKRWTWPLEGTRVKVYQYFMLCHFFYYMFFVIGRVAFEYKEKPHVAVVYIDFYMNVIYLIDMFRCFTEPYT